MKRTQPADRTPSTVICQNGSLLRSHRAIRTGTTRTTLSLRTRIVASRRITPTTSRFISKIRYKAETATSVESASLIGVRPILAIGGVSISRSENVAANAVSTYRDAHRNTTRLSAKYGTTASRIAARVRPNTREARNNI